MNTSEINYILRNNPVTADVFAGVFAADKLQKQSKLPAAYVVNTERAGQPGAHWIAFYQEKDDSMEFFDSFGQPIGAFDEAIQDFCKDVTVVSQNQQLQHALSTACGQYACFFVWKRAKGLKFTTIVHMFSANQANNDKMVTRKVNQVFDVKTRVFDRCLIEQCVRRELNKMF